MKRPQLPTLALQSSLLLLAACQPAPVTQQRNPSPSVTATPSATPSPSVTPSPTVIPSAQPTVSPIPTPSATPTPELTPTPTPDPTPTPTPTPTPLSVGTAQVRVYNDNSELMETALVSVKSLTSGVTYEAKADKQGSTYNFKDLPFNANLELRITAPGYSVRTQLISVSALSPSLQLEFKGNNAITSKPEVLSVTPPGSLTGHKQPLEITFSEGMNRESVEHSLALQLDSSNPSTFPVGTQAPGSLSVRGTENDSVLDIRHFEVSWNGDDILRLTPRYGWPNTSNNRYRLILSYRRNGDPLGGGIKDQDGIFARNTEMSTSSSGGERQDGPFRMGNQYLAYWPLTINTNPNSLELSGLSAIDGDSDQITVTFSGAMYYSLPNGKQVAGGVNGQVNSAAAGVAGVSANAAPANYQLTCNGTPVTWPAGSTATFTDVDKVRIQSPSGQNVFNSGENCELNVSSILDPAGQTVRANSISVRIP